MLFGDRGRMRGRMAEKAWYLVFARLLLSFVRTYYGVRIRVQQLRHRLFTRSNTAMRASLRTT